MELIVTEFKGLEFDETITRRDPSPVIKVDDMYYVYYSKTTSIEGYDAQIWCASSSDGFSWKENGIAIEKGDVGSFDSGSVFTPTVFKADGFIYIIYTAVGDDFDNNSLDKNGLTCFGMAKSKDPIAKFDKISDKPFFETQPAPAFDSHRIDDSCVIKRDGKYYMYYKGRQLSRSPKETKMGVAISAKPEGPYIRYTGNPVVDSGHEVCVYPHDEGVMALVTLVGPHGNTYQYSEDGFHFKILGDLVVPNSVGPYREDDFKDNESFTLHWGVFHGYKGERPYLRRFDVSYPNNK